MTMPSEARQIKPCRITMDLAPVLVRSAKMKKETEFPHSLGPYRTLDHAFTLAHVYPKQSINYGT